MREKFYHIQEFIAGDAVLEFHITFNIEHIILKAHFPGNPIIPGAMLLQITQDLLERMLNSRISISEVIQMKCIKPIHPRVGEKFLFSLSQSDSNNLKYDVEVRIGDLIMAKLQLMLTNPRH